ncbi:MAG: GMC family oxidoreductase [Polyangiaceae bacterium]|nr:GMC family oxidoreductase [Polyangiaceae bacterium]
MNRVDGRTLHVPLDIEADVVIVGSGPAGSAAAREAARLGARVIVVEEGRFFDKSEFPESSFASMAAAYRDMGASVVLGPAPIPFVQGKMVGGSSPINGAICWRMPRDVHAEWIQADPALADALPYEKIEAITLELESRLNVKPTEARIAGTKNLLMAKGAEALGIEHRPIRRNVSDCEGLGRCMQGCPKGNKLSVDATLLSDAESHGAMVVTSVEVTEIERLRDRVVGVRGMSASGKTVRIGARRAVILAASAVQTPAILLKNRIDHGPVGHGFSCHPGVSMAGRFPEPVRMWEGATQGHEVIGLRREGLKFEALGFGLAVMAGRLGGVGRDFAKEIADMAHVVDWGAAVRAEARGRVRVVAGKAQVFYTPTPRDVALFRRGLRVLGEMMLAAGADHVSPGVRGFKPRTSTIADLIELEKAGPTNPAAFTAAITHMFGTCVMGSDPETSVVRTDFRHVALEGLYIADSSVFPSNIGVNPQIPIMAIATLAARAAVGVDVAKATGRGQKVDPAPKQHDKEKPMTTRRAELTLEDLMAMDAKALHEVLLHGHPLEPEKLAGRAYLGVDLSLPDIARKILWHTFRKTFTRDESTGDVRGWNVRMEQHGVNGARIPMRNRKGKSITFGHYIVRKTDGIEFPGDYRGTHYLDYGTVGNPFFDLARLGFTPLVAVNVGSQDLLLGWEVFRVGGKFVPMPLYWALRDEGPLDEVVPRPDEA